MGLFDRVERRLERAVNGAFARAFKSEVQPVEIASAIRRAMDDRAAVLFGAATHDIGKITHPGELSGPGSAHEEAGRRLLLEHGIEPEWARFAATHAAWPEPGVGVEDLLVSLADKVWKNKRVRELEDLVVGRLAEVSGRPVWEEFLALDDLLEPLGAGADHRLAFQASYPVHP